MIPTVEYAQTNQRNATLFGEVVWYFQSKEKIMTYSFPITYVGCQGCHERVNCSHCENRLEEMLMRCNGVYGASIQIAKRLLFVDADISEEELNDFIETIGLLAD
jgi:copper chaperone CopZ